MKKLLGIVVLSLLLSGNAYAGSLVNTKWAITNIPIETTNPPYEIKFLKDGKCKYTKADQSNTDDIPCMWKKINQEIYWTINDFSFVEAKLVRNIIRGSCNNNNDQKWKVIGEKIN